MKILVVGGGGREHAIIWKLKQGRSGLDIYCAPGNGGISDIATCVPIGATDIDGIVAYAKDNAVDLVIVAPDDPLYMGMVDCLNAAGIRAFGPTQCAAEIEGSKVYAKQLMKKYGIPTAEYDVFSDYDSACVYVKRCKLPTVVKADGLALGKGVIICETAQQAIDALKEIMVDKKFGDAGSRVVIEEYIEGPEVSVLSFCDGKTICRWPARRIINAHTTATWAPIRAAWARFRRRRNIRRTERGDRADDHTAHTGCAECGRENLQRRHFFGLMLTADGPKVLEYNARFGDPEAQVVLPRMKNDLLDVMDAVIDGTLCDIDLEWDERSAVCVVMASGGYPGKYNKGLAIRGLDDVAGATVFHAGTAKKDGQYVTNGGRVLGVTALGKDIADARDKAYENVQRISFDGAQYRRDIGIK